MIDNLYDLNDIINAVANRALNRVAEHSFSGQMYVSYTDVADLISKDDFMKYGNLIANELSFRREVLEPVTFDNGELDINMGLAYCKSYQWCEGDEEIFGCSFDEWMQMDAEPVYHPMSITRLAELGENVIEKVVGRPDASILTEKNLGLTESELSELKKLKPEPSPEYIPNEDLRIGKWRVHIADTGEAYGNLFNFVNQGKPLVEFYDMSNIDPTFCPNGQFTGGRYYVDTILGKDGQHSGEYPAGLCLDAGCPAWTVSAGDMKQVVSYLRSFEQRAKKPALQSLIDTAHQKKDSPDNGPGGKSPDRGPDPSRS